MHVIRVDYFVCGYRLMFSCNLRILFIRQLSEGRSVAQHVCIVPIYIGISEYHVAVAVATVTALDVIQMLDTAQN
jgi:hypothetical protein